MSEENVELVRRSLDAVNRRDLEALIALMDHEVRVVSRIAAVEGGLLRGHEGIRKWWDNWLEAFPDWRGRCIALRPKPSKPSARWRRQAIARRARLHGGPGASTAPVTARRLPRTNETPAPAGVL